METLAPSPPEEKRRFSPRGWLEKRMPHHDIVADNPVRAYVLRGTPDAALLLRQTWRRMWRSATAMVAVYAPFFLLILLQGTDNTAFTTLRSLIYALFGLSLLDKLLFDFVAVLSGVTLWQDEIDNARWEQIIVTPLPMTRLVSGWAVIAQMRVWRLLSTLMGVRLGIVLLLILHEMLLPLLAGPSNQPLYDLAQRGPPSTGYLDFTFTIASPLELLVLNLRDDPGLVGMALPLLVALVLAAGVYIVEPRWRLRALAAASVAVSTQRIVTPLNYLAALGTIFGVWFAQIIVIVSSAIIVAYTLGLILAFFDQSLGMILCGYVLVLGFWMPTIYASLGSMWLSTATNRLVNAGGMRA